MRYLLRSSLSVLLAFCMVFFNSYCAIANTTTDSVLLYATEEDYSIMPLIDTGGGTITIECGYYSLGLDRYIFDHANDYLIGVGNIVDGDYGDSVSLIQSNSPTYSNWYSGEMPCYKISFKADDFGVINEPLFIQLTRLSFDLLKDKVSVHSDQLSFYDAYADVKMSGTVKVGNTHFSIPANNSTRYAYSTIPLQPFLIQSSYSDDLSVLDLKLDMNVPYPDEVVYRYDSNYTYHWTYGDYDPDATINTNTHYQDFYNSSIYQIDIYFVLDLSSAMNPDGTVTAYNNINNYMPAPVSANTYDGSKLFVVQREISGSSEDNIITSVSNKISTMGNSISSTVRTQINSVKTQMTQNTNSINAKIDTMSNNIQQGLQNVVQSAQQNTQNIINTVTQKVDEVKTGITEVKDSILDLPNKLEEKVLLLVVPEQDVIESKFSEIEDLLRGRFGLIYQAEEVIVDFANSLQTSTATTEASGGKIIFPSVVVNLPDETVFNFGGYEVDLIPDGFETLANAVRLAVNMVCTAIFINMCKNKLEVIFK